MLPQWIELSRDVRERTAECARLQNNANIYVGTWTFVYSALHYEVIISFLRRYNIFIRLASFCGNWIIFARPIINHETIDTWKNWEMDRTFPKSRPFRFWALPIRFFFFFSKKSCPFVFFEKMLLPLIIDPE